MTHACAARNESTHNPWLLAVGAGIAAALLYLSLRNLAWSRVIRTIAEADWRYLTAAFGIGICSYFVRALRWRVLLNVQAHLSVATVFWANMAGYLGNNLLPARAGELMRTALISRRSSLSKTYVLTTALGERLIDLIALVVATSLALSGSKDRPVWMINVSHTLTFISIGGIVALVVLPHTAELIKNCVRRIPMPGRLLQLALQITEQAVLGLRVFAKLTTLSSFIILTLVVWFLDSSSVVIGARALGLNISFRVAILLLAGMGVGSAVPSTPGYIGVYQFVAVTILPPFGISREAALAYILIAQALGTCIIVLFGVPGLYKSRRSTLSSLDTRGKF